MCSRCFAGQIVVGSLSKDRLAFPMIDLLLARLFHNTDLDVMDNILICFFIIFI